MKKFLATIAAVLTTFAFNANATDSGCVNNCAPTTPSTPVGATAAFAGWTKAGNKTWTGTGGTKTNYSIADDVASVKVDLVRTGSLCGPACPAGVDNNAKITMGLAAMAGGTATHTTDTGRSSAVVASKVSGGAAAMASK